MNIYTIFTIVLLVAAVYGGKPRSVTNHKNIGLINKSICGVASKPAPSKLFGVPWMALLVYNTSRGLSYSCGGTIISERYVLTAASCVKNLPKTIKLIAVRLGEYDYLQDLDCEVMRGRRSCAPRPQTVDIKRTSPHRNYSRQSFRYDIALIKLRKAVDFTSESVRPICLPVTSEEQNRWFHDRELLSVVGWGTTKRDGFPDQKSSVVRDFHVEFVPRKECVASYSNFSAGVSIYEDQICARGTETGDVAAGDGGGPLLSAGFQYAQKVIQYGVISFGPTSGVLDPPGVYTHVGSYMEWILDHMGKKKTKT